MPRKSSSSRPSAARTRAARTRAASTSRSKSAAKSGAKKAVARKSAAKAVVAERKQAKVARAKIRAIRKQNNDTNRALDKQLANAAEKTYKGDISAANRLTNLLNKTTQARIRHQTGGKDNIRKTRSSPLSKNK